MITPAALSRRGFLQGSATAVLVGLVATAEALALERGPYPDDVGRKFYPDGRVHPFAGNTIICHLPNQGANAACFDALLDIYQEAPEHRFMRKVAVLPPSSYHMTVFGGANDASRTRGGWPGDLPLDLPIAACNRVLAERLRAFDPGIALPLRMRIDPRQRAVNGRALSFRLQPIDDTERAKLRGLRNRLADLLKIRASDHDGYHFHISFGYPVAWLDPAEDRDYQACWLRWAADIAAKSPEIVLGAPEYCTFEDMFAFHRQLYLGQRV